MSSSGGLLRVEFIRLHLRVCLPQAPDLFSPLYLFLWVDSGQWNNSKCNASRCLKNAHQDSPSFGSLLLLEAARLANMLDSDQVPHRREGHSRLGSSRQSVS